MSKKKQKRSVTGQKATVKLSDAQLLEEFARHRSAARLREAIDCCKILLQRKSPSVSIDTLADLYLARAGQLADKDMHREAIALWETRRQQCNRDDGRDLLINWLLRAQQFQRAASIYAGLGEAAPSGAAAAFFVSMALAGDPVILKEFPANHPLIKHLPSAKEAIRAYCQGDGEAFSGALAAISFRSPYRELRPLLQGLQRLHQDQAAGDAALAGMSQSSVFGRLAALVAARTKPEEERLKLLANMSPSTRDVATSLWGLPMKIRQSLQDLFRVSAAPLSPRDLLQFVLNHADLLGHDAAKRLALRILPHYPAGLAGVRKGLGEVDNLVELHVRALALGLAKKTHPADEELAWKRLVETLKEQKPGTHRHQLMAAMVLRHLAKFVLSDPFEGMERSLAYRIQSLDFDPGDKTSYLMLIQHYQRKNDRKEADRWLERAIRNLPGDSEVRIAAANAAFLRGAYKKAAGYAEEEIAQNPINNEARNILTNALIAHASKQVTSGKQHLAGKELTLALSHARDNVQRGNVLLNIGLLDLLNNAGTTGGRLAEGYQVRGGGMAADLRILVDGQCLGIPEGRLLKEWLQLQSAHGRPWDKQEVIHGVLLVRQKLATNPKELRWAMGQIEKTLSKMSALAFSPEERKEICDALAAACSYDALQAFARHGLREQPETPAFIYYESVGLYRGNSVKFQTKGRKKEHMALEHALDRAEDEGDEKLVAKIEAWLGNDFIDDFYVPPFLDNVDEHGPPDIPFPFPPPQEMLDFIRKMMGGAGKKKGGGAGRGTGAGRKNQRSLFPFDDDDE